MAAVPRAPAAHNAIPRPLAPPHGAPLGLRPSGDRHALGSSFFARSAAPLLLPPHATPKAAPKFSTRVATKQAYICRDCGYIYSDTRKPFEKLPDSFFCPVCGAPKRRFKPYEPTVSKNANDLDVRKARKAQLKRDEAVGNSLPIAIAVGIALLAAVYLYLNNAYT